MSLTTIKGLRDTDSQEAEPSERVEKLSNMRIRKLSRVRVEKLSRVSFSHRRLNKR